MSFLDIIGHAELETFDSQLFPQSPGDKDKGDVEAGLFEERQSLHARPAVEAVIGKDDVEGLLAQDASEILPRGDTLEVEMKVRFLEFLKGDLYVVLLMLNEQETQRIRGHRCGFRGVARQRHGCPRSPESTIADGLTPEGSRRKSNGCKGTGNISAQKPKSPLGLNA